MKNTKTSILVVDDEADIRDLLTYNLEQEGYAVRSFSNGEDAIKSVESQIPDLILLDLMLPGTSGLEICRRLKRETSLSSIPIIMISAKSTETDVVVGLELGADDYITKPFSPKEVVARVRALLRRMEEKKPDASGPRQYKFRGIEVDLDRHEVTIDKKEVKLTSTEFKILQCLLSRPGNVFSRDELIDFALGRNISVVDRTIDVHMTNLRKKIGSYGALIESIRSVGYRLKDSD